MHSLRFSLKGTFVWYTKASMIIKGILACSLLFFGFRSLRRKSEWKKISKDDCARYAINVQPISNGQSSQGLPRRVLHLQIQSATKISALPKKAKNIKQACAMHENVPRKKYQCSFLKKAQLFCVLQALQGKVKKVVKTLLCSQFSMKNISR